MPLPFDKNILQKYAMKSDPQNLPPNVYFHHTEDTITIFDAFPKAEFHFLILPRPDATVKEGPLSVQNLSSLKTFMKYPTTKKEDIKALLGCLKKDGEQVREMIKEEMRSRYGFVWGVHIGFHAVESMTHIHLHVISEDLCAPGLKTKKHYNSFRPKLGFFLHLDDVTSWFDDDTTESYTQSMINLDTLSYEKKLKESLECFRCEVTLKNIPELKKHLQEHFNEMRHKGKAAEASKKRKLNEVLSSEKKEGAQSGLELGRKEAVLTMENEVEGSGPNSVVRTPPSSQAGIFDEAPRKKHKGV